VKILPSKENKKKGPKKTSFRVVQKTPGFKMCTQIGGTPPCFFPPKLAILTLLLREIYWKSVKKF